MFGVMDLTTGKCWENNGDIEPYYKKQFQGVDNNIAVPKEYINWWTSGHKCEKEGCFKDGSVECHVPEVGDYIDMLELKEHFCSDHAYESGYCVLCGDFYSGIESFDFNNPFHLCENCKEQIDDEDSGHDDDIDEMEM